jgi:hypothetical protein
LTRDRDEYLAGVGNVAAFLEAREGLANFYRGAALDIGLEALGLAPELGMLRAWSRAERLASLGQIAPLSNSTRQALTRWYRSRIVDVFGSAAHSLSPDELTVFARLEDEGVDLRQLAGSGACRL